MIFLDANILIDLNDPRGAWHGWSRRMIAAHTPIQLATNLIALSEFASQFGSSILLDQWARAASVDVIALDVETAFRAGIAFKLYRRRGGLRTSILPDFLIGAHAATLGATLLTRDAARFARYFPELALITPESHP